MKTIITGKDINYCNSKLREVLSKQNEYRYESIKFESDVYHKFSLLDYKVNNLKFFNELFNTKLDIIEASNNNNFMELKELISSLNSTKDKIRVYKDSTDYYLLFGLIGISLMLNLFILYFLLV